MINKLEITKLYDSYPRRYGKSSRILYKKEEFVECVNRDNGFGDVFISVYSYARLKQAGEYYRIDSNSAILDKLFIDMDIKDWIDYDKEKLVYFKKNIESCTKSLKLNKKELEIVYKINKNINLTSETDKKVFLKMYEKVKKPKAEKDLFGCVVRLEDILRKNNALRIWSFSGGGFHLYIYIADNPNNKKVFFKNCVDFISKQVCDPEDYYYEYILVDGELQLKRRRRQLWDPHCPPKLSQMVRVIGTFNPRRKKYCVSLCEEDIDKGLEWIKEKSEKGLDRDKIHYLGTNVIEFGSKFDTSEVLESCSITVDSGVEEYSSNLKELLFSLGVLMDEIPPCIKRFVKEEQKLCYIERYFLITYLYRCGLGKEEIVEVLKLVLTADRLYHCCGVVKGNYKPPASEKARVEVQVENIVENDYYLSCSQIKNHGLCVSNCTIKDVMYYLC